MMETESILLHTFEQDNKSAQVYYSGQKYIVVYKEMCGTELIQTGIDKFDVELDAELFAEILVEGV